MNSKILPAVVVSAGVALSGCASTVTSLDPPPPLDCRSNTCEVSVDYNMIGTIIARDILVNADAATVVQITFVVNSWFGARFPPDGVTVSSNFQCALVAGTTTRILCTGTNLQRNQNYKYGVRLRAGIGTPWPIDPFIRN